MLSNEINKISKLTTHLNRIATKSKDNKRVPKATFQWLTNNIESYYKAFNKIATNKGAGTAGIDSQTIDGLTLKTIKKWNDEIREGIYEPSPVKRVEIPKPNDKTRPIGIPTVKDRTIQEVIRCQLEAYYEPKFSEDNFGFRPGKSCHDALKRFQQKFKGINWFIKIDLKDFFDTVNHNILYEIIDKHITKYKVKRLIARMVKSGVMKKGQHIPTHSGTPQGGIISPILSNIMLNELDSYIKNLKGELSRFLKTKDNPTYRKILRKIEKGKEKKDKELVKRLQRELKGICCDKQKSIRIEYIRYADDFIIGVSCQSKTLPEQIKKMVMEFIEEKLKLKTSIDKTKIQKTKKGIEFLGYELMVEPTKEDIREKNTKSSLNGKPQLKMNRNLIAEKAKELGWINKNNKIIHNKSLLSLEKLEIIRNYKAIFSGITNYYSYISNISQLNKWYYYATYSLLKTLGGKDKSSIATVRKKYRIGKSFGIKYETKTKFRYDIWPAFSWNYVKGLRKYQKINLTPNANSYKTKTKLTDRLQAVKCENCRKDRKQLEIHHTKTIRNKNWQSIRNKKTKILCKDCHRKITNQQINTFAWFQKTQKQNKLSK
ncbi:MAG: reverse transcriptase domain-containing protein [Phytoplasma sp.]|uniref:reverse transcriptase domain-containing protein n=1 Tax=Phytoplasma sp. TaxID=2155 RepID=UPI002B415242|nr:reverse transcriptase domain-containing protein [Phytoplasma sp.]WRH06956.1 MAG: reverse transcriptase domain-containing protein [Phytoplasma sp.]